MRALKILSLTAVGLMLSAGVVGAVDLGVTTGAAMAGSNYGMELTFDGADLAAAYVQDDTPASETTMRVFFRTRPSGLSMNISDGHDTYRATAVGREAFIMKYRYFNVFGGSPYVQIHARRDDNSLARGLLAIANVQSGFLIEWQAASALGANDGFIRLYVRQAGGTFHCLGEVTGIDNDTQIVNTQRLGAMGGIDAATVGAIQYDTFESYRTLLAGSPVCDQSFVDSP